MPTAAAAAVIDKVALSTDMILLLVTTLLMKVRLYAVDKLVIGGHR